MKMAENAQSSQQSTTLAQKTEIVAAVAMFVMLPVVIFLRRKAGYRFLNPTRLFAMVLILLIYAQAAILTAATSGLSTPNAYPTTAQAALDASAQQQAQMAAGYIGGVLLTIFALVVLVLGLIQRWRRWKDITNGIPWHTYSRGVSWFSFLPLADNQIKRFVDPAVCLVIGLIVAFVFKFSYLGYYLIFAAACLFIFESWDYEQNLNKMLDTLDSLVDSEVMSENVEYYSQPHPTQRPITETAGIPTGVAPDIEAQIQKRKSRPALVPDNLVVATTTGNLPGAAI